MTPEEFREAAHELVDWIADYRSTVEERRVRSDVAPGDIVAALPAEPPAEREPASAVIRDFQEIIAPASTEIQHPMHFGWFPSNASLSSILGDFASSGLSALGISWESSPPLTELEEVVSDWLRQLCGLSDRWKGVIQDTASTSALVAMIAAREKASNHAQVTSGILGFAKRLTVYTTAEAHSSVRKAALLAGFAAADLRNIDMDPHSHDMLPDALAAAIEADLAAGCVPAIVVASAGSTGITAFDPLPPIADLCESHDIWLHVDAAMAGAALVLPEQRGLFDGIERADSIAWNPHKWFGTILDCSMMYLRDPDHLVQVMSTNPSYLHTTVNGDSDSDGDGESNAATYEPTQYRDWGIPLGRRFRSLKLWYQLRIDGIESIRERLRRDLDNAQWFAAQIEALDEWEIVAPVRLQTVAIRHRPTSMTEQQVSEHNRDWAAAINATGRAFVTPSILDGIWMVRVSIGVESTERHHLGALIDLIKQAAAV